MKPIIYQVLPRLFGNRNIKCIRNGTIEQNGCGKMNDFSDTLLHRLREFGITHIWYTGIIRHANKTDYTKFGIPNSHPAVVKGKAGSPYAITDYYDIDPDIAVDVEHRMDEFQSLVERTHHAGLQVIIDFVPNHVARQYHSVMKPESVRDLGEDDNTSVSFSYNNNFYYFPGAAFSPQFDLKGEAEKPYNEFPAKATGNDHFDAHPSTYDWYETVKLNYGVDYMGGGNTYFTPIPSTWFKMRDILLFWANLGVDGFRCDMAEMVPQKFWRWAISTVKSQYHVIFIGEVYQLHLFASFVNNCGFDYLYDKVTLCDTLRDVVCKGFSARAITLSWQMTDAIHTHMLGQLENHDEQRMASDFLAGDAFKVLPALIVSMMFQNHPYMLYMGQELGERGMYEEGFSGRDGRTSIFDYCNVPSICRWLNGESTDSEKRIYNEYKKITHIATSERAVDDGKSFDLMYANPDSDHFNGDNIFAFLRKYDNELLLIVVNFSDEESNVRVQIPNHAFDYMEIPQQPCDGVDLLETTNNIRVNFTPNCEVPVKIRAHYGCIYKFSKWMKSC